MLLLADWRIFAFIGKLLDYRSPASNGSVGSASRSKAANSWQGSSNAGIVGGVIAGASIAVIVLAAILYRSLTRSLRALAASMADESSQSGSDDDGRHLVQDAAAPSITSTKLPHAASHEAMAHKSWGTVQQQEQRHGSSWKERSRKASALPSADARAAGGDEKTSVVKEYYTGSQGVASVEIVVDATHAVHAVLEATCPGSRTGAETAGCEAGSEASTPTYPNTHYAAAPNTVTSDLLLLLGGLRRDMFVDVDIAVQQVGLVRGSVQAARY